LATWTEVKNFISSNYDVKKEGDNYIQLVQEFSDGRSQLVFVLRKEYQRNAWIEITAPIGTLKSSDLEPALEILDYKACGGMVKVGKMHAVRHCCPIADLTDNELIHPILLVAGAADMLEEEFIGGDEF